MKKKLALSILTALCAIYVNAQPGTLDITFPDNGSLGENGHLIDSVSSYASPVYAAVLQPDGMLVLGGHLYNGSNYDFMLLRYKPDGTLDPSFGTGGMVTTAFASSNDKISSLALQADGKIIAAGGSDNGTKYDFAAARYNPDGTLDNTFDGDGKVTTEIGTVHDFAEDVAIQADGKIILAGYTGNGMTNYFVVVRYNTDGSLDNSFDSDGKVSHIVVPGVNFGESVAIQANGKIVVGGSAGSGANLDFAVARYNSDGSLDNTFSGDGMLTTAVGSGHDEIQSIAIQPDGKIVVAGDVHNGSNYDYAVARYNDNGTLDNTFDTDGIQTTAIGLGDDIARAMTIQADGKIVLSGYSDAGGTNDFSMARYDTNGILNNTFSTDGKLVTNITTNDDKANAVVIQANEKIMSVGSSGLFPDIYLAFARYNKDGTIDSYFDGTGTVTNVFSTSSDDIKDVAIQKDGKIVVAATHGDTSGFFIVRYTNMGVLDTAFSDNGQLITSFGGTSDASMAIAVQEDGKIVAVGSTNSGANYDVAVARYLEDGTIDSTFDADGKAITDISSGFDIVYDVLIQPDGKIVVCSYTVAGPSNGFGFVRYNANGTLDNSFSGDGKLIVPVGQDGTAAPLEMAIQEDNKIIATGYAMMGSNLDVIVIRLDTNGVLDNTFDGDGIVNIDFLDSTDAASSVAVQPDGKIVVAGQAFNVSNDDVAIARLNTDGSLDNTFDSDGKLTKGFGVFSDHAKQVLVQPDDKIVIAGGSGISTDPDFLVMRYNTDGTPDNTFDADGYNKTAIGFDSDWANAAAFQHDGKILLAGFYEYTTNKNSFAFARYLNEPPVQTSGITVSNQMLTSATLSWKNGCGNKRAVFVKLESDNSFDFPVHTTEYTADPDYGSGQKLGASNWYCVYSGSDSSVDVTNLTSFTEYQVVSFEYNVYQPTYNTDTASSVNLITFITDGPPTIQASSLIQTNNTDTSLSVQWTNGNGSKRSVWVTQATSGTCAPVNGEIYTASPDFGAGDEIGGWYCVYNDTGTAVTVTGLQSNTTYRFHVCEYMDFTATMYLTTTETGNPANFTTDFKFPAVQASNLAASDIEDDRFTLSWNPGNGSYSIVFLQDDTTGTAMPVNDQTYTTSATFKDGNQIGTSGWYCVHKGTDTSVTIIGLTVNKTYRAMVCTYNGTPGAEKYLTSSASGNPVNFRTIYDTPTTQAHDIVVETGENTISISWQSGNGDKRLVFITKIDTGNTPVPVNTTTYNADPVMDSGDQIGTSGWYCVYNGTGNTVEITNIEAVTHYRIMVCEYNGTEGAESYMTSTATGNPADVFAPLDICIITIDLETGKNMVVWERTANKNIDYYNVYRETSSQGVYALIGQIPFNNLSLFVDTNSIPNQQQYLYKVTAVDSSGNETPIDDTRYHKTMLLQYAGSTGGINLSWSNRYEIDGVPFDYDSYIIYRGTDSTTLDSINTVSGSLFAYVDTDPVANQGRVYYRVAGVLNNRECAPTSIFKADAGPFSQSLSNLEDNRLKGDAIGNEVADQINLQVYPNPFRKQTTIAYTIQNTSKVSIEVYNVVGEKLETIVNKELEQGNYRYQYEPDMPGVYYLQFTIDGDMVTKKIIGL